MKLVRVLQSKASTPALERTNVRRFLAWTQSVGEHKRAEAARILAWAYCSHSLIEEIQSDLEICLSVLVEDESTLVRRALAEAVAGANNAPRHVVAALAEDAPDIAAIVLAQSPILTDAELAERAVACDDELQTTLAGRAGQGDRLAASLAEFGHREAVLALIKDCEARLGAEALWRIADRFSDYAAVRDALLARSDLPAAIRYDLVEAGLRARFTNGEAAMAPKRLDEATRPLREREAARIAVSCAAEEALLFARHLRFKGVLTPALLLRALVSGADAFFCAATAELSGMAPRQAMALVKAPYGAGFAALYRRAGLPPQFIEPCRAALAALNEARDRNGPAVQRLLASRVIAVCENLAAPDLDWLVALLRRLAKEAALAEARALSESVAAETKAEREEALTEPQNEQKALASSIAAFWRKKEGAEADAALRLAAAFGDRFSLVAGPLGGRFFSRVATPLGVR